MIRGGDPCKDVNIVYLLRNESGVSYPGSCANEWSTFYDKNFDTSNLGEGTAPFDPFKNYFVLQQYINAVE